MNVITAGYTEGSDYAVAAEEYGYHLGMAYQIVDDILDFTGTTIDHRFLSYEVPYITVFFHTKYPFIVYSFKPFSLSLARTHSLSTSFLIHIFPL